MNAIKVVKTGKRLDLFCWKCHKNDTNIGCSRCQRSFHNKCLSMTKKIDSNWVCIECVDHSSGNHGLDSIQLQQLLLMSLKMISKSADYYFNEDNCFRDKRIKIRSDLIVNPINLKTIESNINAFEYKSFSELTSDMKWLLHNSIVGGLESGLIENAKFLLSKAKSEQKDFEECVHCFINYYKTNKTQYYSWFSKPCPKPHTLVWAKVRGHPYWPSKVMKIDKQKASVMVRFFGTHQKSWCKEKDCYLLSKEIPKPLVGKGLQISELLDTAVEEVRYHIRYMETEHPKWFSYAPKRTALSINKLTENQISTKNCENSVKTSSFPNRPDGWKPKARKSFPTPNSSKNVDSIGKTGLPVVLNDKCDLKSQTVNPFEITYISPAISGPKKAMKSRPQIEIIEFNSKSKKSFENEVKTENTFKTKSNVNAINVQTFDDLKAEDTSFGAVHSNCVQLNDSVYKRKNKSFEIKSKINRNFKTNEKQNKTVIKTIENLKKRNQYLEKKIETNDQLFRKRLKAEKLKSELALNQLKLTIEEENQKAVSEERSKQLSAYDNNLSKLKETFDLGLKELNERHTLKVNELTERFENELKDSKTKIWCYNCLKEAELYCCSHTYYCSIDCQQTHWRLHKQICTQK